MNTEQPSSSTSAKAAFVLGAGSALVAALVIIFAVRHEGKANAVVAPPAPVEASIPAQSPPASEGMGMPTAAPATSSAHPTRGESAPADHASLFSGTIVLDRSIAQSVSGKAIVFVIARSGSGKGHPVLARRLDVESFPVAFSLGPQDSMTGQTPSGSVSLEARIDFDGDAMTREPNAPSARIDSVAVGSHNLSLTLRLGQ